MWLYMIAAAIAVIGIVVGFTGGGIFTIVLLPLAFIILVAGVLFGMVGRAQQGAEGQETNATHTTGRPLPHHRTPAAEPAPSSPEALADARRVQQ
jgi:hypothetical protein